MANRLNKLISISENLSDVCTELTNHISELISSKGVNLADRKVFNTIDKLTHDVAKLQRQSHKMLDVIDEEMDDLK